MISRVVYRCISSSSKRCTQIGGQQLAPYKSSLSLDKVYPGSSLDLTKSPEIPEAGSDKFSGYIPMDKIQITASKSSGPGGQGVNTTNSKVDVRFKVVEAAWIPEKIRSTMVTKLRSHITKEGFFIVQSDRTRSKQLNTADALEKLREFIRSCEPKILAEPSPETLEKFRRQQEKAARERLRVKRERHTVKESRGSASVNNM